MELRTFVEALEAALLRDELAHEDLLRVAFAFERRRGLEDESAKVEQAVAFGWPAELADAPLDEPTLARLRDRVVERIRRSPHAPWVGTAVWALGKARDPALRETFLDLLEILEVARSPEVYQVMLALQDLDESPDPFGGRRSLFVGDVERNLVDARAHLARVRPR